MHLRPLDRKLVRDLWSLRGQVITIAVVVACGIASFVTMRSAWSSLAWSKDTYFERYRFADVFAQLERAPESLTWRIQAIPGVERTYTRVVETALLPMEDMIEPAHATLVSVPTGNEPVLNAVFLRKGRLPRFGSGDEAVVVESFAQAHGLVIGDRVPVVIGGRLRRVKIVGVGLSPEFVFLASAGDFTVDNRKRAVLWMERRTLAAAFRMEGAFNDVSLRLQPAASEAAVLADLDRLLEPYGGLGAVPRKKQISNFMLEGELSQLEKMATVVPVIFLAVAAFLLNVVLSRLVLLQRQQIASLKALGYRDRQITAHYLELCSVIVSLGGVLGVALGAWLGQSLTELYGSFFRFPSLDYRLELWIVFVGFAVSLVAAVAGALLGLRQIASMTPAEAMQPPAPPRYRRGYFDRLGLQRVFGVSAIMVFREIKRRPLRLAISAVAISASIGIMIVGRFASDSMDNLIDVIFGMEQRGELSVAFREPQPIGIVRELKSLPGVEAAEGTRLVAVRVHSGPRFRDASITGLAESPRLRRVVDRNANLVDIPGAGLSLSRKLAEILSVGVGDAVEIELREGSRRHLRVPVVMLVDDAFGLQGYMSSAYLHRLLGEERKISAVQLDVDGLYQEAILGRLKEMPDVAGTMVKTDVIRRFKEQSAESMQLMTVLLSIFGAAIAIGVVYNNARVSLSLRSRDLSSLRVLGFTRAEISHVLLGELGIQVLLSIPIGMWLGNLWAKAIMSMVDPETYRFTTTIAASTYAYATVVTLCAAAISAFMVRRKLDRLDLIEVLKSRE